MREILKISWPLALGMINNGILHFTDRAFIARESMAGLEASMSASMLALVILCFFQSVVAYSGTFVAQFIGAKDRCGATMSYHAGLWIAVFSAFAALALIPVGSFILARFSNGAEIFALQKMYFSVCTAGGFFLFAQMAVQSFFTGLGLTRVIFVVNLIGNLVNVVLDYILIFGKFGFPHLGLAGAAYATVCATAVQWAILSLAAHGHVERHAPHRLSVEMFALIGKILKFGLPSGAYSFLNLISFTIFVFILGLVGHVEAAVSNACFTVNYLLFAPMEGLAQGAATLVGQSQGARDSKKAEKYAMNTLILGLSLAATLSILTLVFHRPILAMFAPDDPAIAARFQELGLTLLLLMTAWQLFDAADIIIGGALKGAGDTKFVFYWMLFCSIVLWLPLVLIVRSFSNTMPALWSTMIVYVVVICIGSLIRFKKGKWKSISMTK